jgi:virulence-associated protein VagC
MTKVKVFKHGDNLAVTLPRKFRVKGNIVDIFDWDGDLILRDPTKNSEKFWDLVYNCPYNFMEDSDGMPVRKYFPEFIKVPPQKMIMPSQVRRIPSKAKRLSSNLRKIRPRWGIPRPIRKIPPMIRGMRPKEID